MKAAVREERLLLERLYSEAFLLLVPSRADCGSLLRGGGFSLPVITSGVGGIGDIVDGKNGLNVGVAATTVVYAEKVKLLINDQKAYAALSLGTCSQYKRC